MSDKITLISGTYYKRKYERTHYNICNKISLHMHNVGVKTSWKME